MLKRHPLIFFFLLAYLFSWYPWLLSLAHVTRGEGGLNPLGPLVAAILVAALSERWPGVRGVLKRLLVFRTGARWYAVVLLLPVLICIMAAGLNVLAGAARPAGAHLAVPGDLLPRFVFIFLFIGLGEETGWRGYALPRLLQRYSELRASLLLGVLWGIWHVPLLSTELKPEFRLPFVIGILSASVLHTWVFRRSRGSVFLQMLFHSTVNTVGAGYIFRMFTGADLVRMWWIFAALWCLAAVGVALAVKSFSRAPETILASTPAV